MICPKCRAEYIPGVTVCYDCDVDLLEEAPETGPEQGAPAPQGKRRRDLQGEPQGEFELVPVFTTYDSALVVIAETMLQSARIPVIVEGAGHQGYWGPGPLGLHQPRGQFSVCVAPQDAADARDILAELLGGS